MQLLKKNHYIRFVLFSNGVVDLAAAIAFFFPVLNLPLPGYLSYVSQTSFVASGWGIATLTLGIGRIWASYKPEVYRFMVILGILEATLLAAYCLISVLFLEITLLQAIMPLSLGILYSILYFIGFCIHRA